MGFDGPQAADYDNVAALNEAYLLLLAREQRLGDALSALPVRVREKLQCLKHAEIQRLSRAPFLLFSFREQDARYWQRILADAGNRDLFAVGGSDELDTLVSGGLGFMWQLARQNPFALRLISGASLHWCEQIAELTFFRLLDSVALQGDVPVPRFATHHELWRKLVGPGISRKSSCRQAAQMSALQAVLTRQTGTRSIEPLPVAARRLSASGMVLADK